MEKKKLVIDEYGLILGLNLDAGASCSITLILSYSQ